MSGDMGEQLADETASSAPLKIAPIPDGYRSAEKDGVKTISNFENDEQPKEGKEEVSKAASELGKKGGKASAEKRKAEAKESPEEAAERAAAASGKGDRKNSSRSGDSSGDEDADVSGADREVESGSGDKPLGKPDRDPRARVAEATREAREAREEARQLREEASRVRYELEQERRARQQPDPRQQQAQPQRDPSQKPKLEDFEDYGEYTEALTDYKVQERFRAVEEEQHVRQGVERMARGVQDGMDKFRGVLEAADAEDADWSERVDERLWSAIKPTWMVPANEPIRGQNVLFDRLTQSEMAPALLLYFSDESGQREFSRIARLQSPVEIAVEMARLEERLRPATAGTRPESSVSKAPLPFQPVKGAPHTGERVPGPDASYEEHKAYWNAKDRKSASR